MLTPARTMLLVATLVSAVAVWTGAASADGTGPVTCDPQVQTCDVVVGGGGTTSPGSSGGSSGGRVCRDKHDNHVVRCWRADLGWFGYDGCYYKSQRMSADELAAIDAKPNSKPGVWYMQNCFIDPTEVIANVSLVYRNNPPAPVPEVVALHAVSRLVLPKLTTVASPTGTQLVRLPSWWWSAPSSWRVQSATASVPGISVTATATPVKAVWNPGDGTGEVTCAGAGTPWKPGTDPLASSPTCGHTYARSSASAEGGAFTLTATVVWRVTWVGGGTSGTEPDLRTTTTVPVRVGESQTVITR